MSKKLNGLADGSGRNPRLAPGLPVPKIFRALAGVTLILFFWLVLQIFRAPVTPSPLAEKSKSSIEDMIKDPNLDREYSELTFAT